MFAKNKVIDNFQILHEKGSDFKRLGTPNFQFQERRHLSLTSYQ